MQDVKYEDEPNEVEKAAWESLYNVIINFGAILRQKSIVM